MAVYAVNMVSVFLFSWMADAYRHRSPGPTVTLDKQKLPLLWFSLLVVLAFTLLSSLRFMVGTDYVNYCIVYDNIAFRGVESVAGEKLELGFVYLCRALSYFSKQPFLMFAVVALLTNGLMVMAMRRYSNAFWMSCMLYIFAFTFYATFNAVRQAIAVAIIFYATRHVVEGNFLKYAVLVLIASLFHISAIIMIPVYFVVRRPAWSRLMLAVGAGVVVCVIFYDIFFEALLGLLSGSRYSMYDVASVSSQPGVNAIRILVVLAPLLLAFLFRRRLRKKFPASDVIVNLCTLCGYIMIFASQQIYLARMASYFSCYTLLLLPMLPKLFRDRRLRALMTAAILVCFFLYCMVLMPINGDVLPYYSIFDVPPGWRISDQIAIF